MSVDSVSIDSVRRLDAGRVEQRRKNLVFGGCAVARAEIEGVIGVYTISDCGKATRLRQTIQNRKQFVLAEITARAIVLDVIGIAELRGAAIVANVGVGDRRDFPFHGFR